MPADYCRPAVRPRLGPQPAAPAALGSGLNSGLRSCAQNIGRFGNRTHIKPQSSSFMVLVVLISPRTHAPARNLHARCCAIFCQDALQRSYFVIFRDTFYFSSIANITELTRRNSRKYLRVFCGLTSQNPPPPFKKKKYPPPI